MATFKAKLYRKSISAVAWLDGGMPKIIMGWFACIVVAGILRTSFAASPITSGASLFQTVLPYMLLGFSPVAAYWIADQLFPRGLLMQQPEIRLSRIGKWRSVDVLVARASPIFGPTGFMASLLIGMLLNVPFRSLEFLGRDDGGFDRGTGERGRNLSGGQRGFLVLARALAAPSKLLFLDEPTGAMDMRTEMRFVERLKTAIYPGQTLIVSTHRHAVLSLCDRLIVMDRGKIVADGPREQIMAQAMANGVAA